MRMSLKSSRSPSPNFSNSSGSSFDSGDNVVKHGILYIKRQGTKGKLRFKPWQKRYLVLRDESEEANAHIEIFFSENHKDTKVRLDLGHVTSVEEYRKSQKFPEALIIYKDNGDAFVLGEKSRFEANQWKTAITLLSQKQRNLSRSISSNETERLKPAIPYREEPLDLCYIEKDDNYYCVRVIPTEASTRLKLAGNLFMSVSASHVKLSDANNPHRVEWALLDIIKFKCADDPANYGVQILTLQAAISCGVKEGSFKFRSTFGKELITEVSSAFRELTISRQNDSPPARNISRKNNNSAAEDYHTYLTLLQDSELPSSDHTNNYPTREFGEFPNKSNSGAKNLHGFKDLQKDHAKEPPIPPPRPKHTLPGYTACS